MFPNGFSVYCGRRHTLSEVGVWSATVLYSVTTRVHPGKHPRICHYLVRGCVVANLMAFLPFSFVLFLLLRSNDFAQPPNLLVQYCVELYSSHQKTPWAASRCDGFVYFLAVIGIQSIRNQHWDNQGKISRQDSPTQQQDWLHHTQLAARPIPTCIAKPKSESRVHDCR